MPWLAPIGTPDDSGPIESQVPIWQSIRASRSSRICFHARQRLRQHRQALHRLGVGKGMRFARAQALDAMVDGADAGRKPQPFRRVHGHGGIEDRRARHHEVMAHHFLDLAALLGDAGDRAELAAGNRGRHADLAHGRRIHWRRDAPGRPDPVDVVGGANVIGKAKLHRLGAVRDRAAADRDDEVGAGAARLLGGGNDGRARRVRRHRIEGADAAGPERFPDLVDLVGGPVERAADHQEGAVRAQAVHLAYDRLGGGAAEHDLVHGAENDTPAVHDDCPPGTSLACWCLANNLAEVERRREPKNDGRCARERSAN